MVKRELVDAEGYISDDSSFCGGEDMKTQYEDLLESPERSNSYSSPFTVPPYKKLKHLESAPPTMSSKSQHAVKSEPMSDHDVLNFLKHRPQLDSMKKAQVKPSEPAKFEKSRTVDGKAADDLIHIDTFKDHPAGWQQKETVQEFLRRLPVEDPATNRVGHWLWVGRPTIPYAHSKRKEPEEEITFKASAAELLQSFELQRGKIEGDNPGKVAATITKKLTPFRDQLEGDLLTLAVKMGFTSGKWMLFPHQSDLARVWRVVATATADGTLGPVSKVGTFDPDRTEPNTLICIYTYDFSDLQDVRRVLNEIVNLGLCHANGKPIYYKCDGYTYLEISSSNSYKLKASLYSSKEILHNEVKALANGPVARMKKRSSKMTDFYQMFAGDDIS